MIRFSLWTRRASIGSSSAFGGSLCRQRPHGLDYSLTLHGKNSERLIGFDNAHGARQSARPGGAGDVEYDHKHSLQSVRPYRYRDAAELLADFWAEVDRVLRERGVLR